MKAERIAVVILKAACIASLTALLAIYVYGSAQPTREPLPTELNPRP